MSVVGARAQTVRRSGRRRRILAVGAAVALAVTVTAAVPTADAATGHAARIHAAKIQYTKRTVVVPTAVLRSQLLSVSATGATYTFRSRRGVLGRLRPGSVMLLQGLAVRAVSKTAMSKGHLVVTSKPAKITDLISTGTLAWNTPINLAKGFGLGGAGVPMLAGAAARTAPSVPARFGMQPMAAGAGITLKGKANSYGYSVSFKPAGTSVAVAITITKDSPVEVEAQITGTLHNLTTAGNISVNKGKLTSAKMLANGLRGSFKLAYSAKPISAFGLGQAGGIKITLPAELVVPFTVGPVPLFLGVKVAFFASAGFSGFDQELSGSYSFDYDGQGGFTTSSSGATSAAGAAKGLGKILLNAANAVHTGPISFVFGAQMPQLELGLGVKGLNVAGNVTMIGTTGIANAGGCDTRQMRVLGTAGANASFLGFSAGLGSATLFDKTVNASWPRGCGTFPS